MIRTRDKRTPPVPIPDGFVVPVSRLRLSNEDKEKTNQKTADQNVTIAFSNLQLNFKIRFSKKRLTGEP